MTIVVLGLKVKRKLKLLCPKDISISKFNKKIAFEYSWVVIV